MRLGRWSLAVALAALLGTGCGRSAPNGGVVSCPDPVAGCRFELGGEALALRFSESPRPMRPFAMEVEAPRAVAVEADFSMPGMDMLPNRYRLARAPGGHWRATVVLPVCVSGREDWQLALTVGDRRVSVPFTTGR